MLEALWKHAQYRPPDLTLAASLRGRSSWTFAASSFIRELAACGGCQGQHLESARKWLRRRAGGNDLGDDFQTAQEVSGAIGLGEAGVAVDDGHHGAGEIGGGIKDTERARAAQLGDDLRAEPAVGEPQIDDGKVRFVTLTERDGLGDGPSDAANLVSVLDEYLF